MLSASFICCCSVDLQGMREDYASLSKALQDVQRQNDSGKSNQPELAALQEQQDALAARIDKIQASTPSGEQRSSNKQIKE